MRPFEINRHGRIVFPSSYFPDMDLSDFRTLEQFEAAVRRDFDEKSPTGSDIVERVEAGKYSTRFELLRDVALNLFWGNRYVVTLYERRPTRWRDVPRHSDDVFLGVAKPWVDGARKIAAVAETYRALPPTWNGQSEDAIFQLLFHIFGHKRYHASDLPAVKPTVAELLAKPETLTFVLPGHDPDYPRYTARQILDHSDEVPELESLGRWARVLHNLHPWDQAAARLAPASSISDDDFVLLYVPRSEAVTQFIHRIKQPTHQSAPVPVVIEAQPPVRPFPALDVPRTFRVQPRIAALTALRGEHVCSNDDVIRNSAINWSPMSAAQIARKTGIDSRCYTAKPLEQIALEVARTAVAGAGLTPGEIGAVLVCTCTSDRLIPSVASYISGQLGIHRTYMSADLVAACAGFPYGLAESVRLLQEVQRPVLLVCAEKFSNKIGSVRTSRMLFADGAAALVLVPAPDGEPGDIEYLQTYASGPVSEVNSILWPNPEFDGNITVYGPEVKSLAKRYLAQMLDEMKEIPGPDGSGNLFDAVDVMVPHQANKVMVADIARGVNFPMERVYFNIERTGNVSAASIPLAIHDAVLDGVIDRPMRVFAPGFGAGAVAGYAVLNLDPSVVVRTDGADGPAESAVQVRGTSVEDVAQAFS
ncbi:MAG TPA: 3-oxoacyl-[acyl-carrier-protein] synthase III C-terminal domain-containing protein [Sporichthyaceae bacterium]|jgi:3-oxoacyl-(acyl-carrier-protein) synthase III